MKALPWLIIFLLAIIILFNFPLVMNYFTEININATTILAAIIGGSISGFITFLGVLLTIKESEKSKKNSIEQNFDIRFSERLKRFNEYKEKIFNKEVNSETYLTYDFVSELRMLEESEFAQVIGKRNKIYEYTASHTNIIRSSYEFLIDMVEESEIEDIRKEKYFTELHNTLNRLECSIILAYVYCHLFANQSFELEFNRDKKYCRMIDDFEYTGFPDRYIKSIINHISKNKVESK